MSKPLKILSEVPYSPLQRLRSPQLEAAQVDCWIKRDDLLYLPVLGNAFAFSGNKWRKLKYNLIKAQESNKHQLLTFGGAYSNHLAAVAAAGHYFGFATIGIVRGEAPSILNPTLQFVKSCGMQLEFISRKDYRQKETINFQDYLRSKFGQFYAIPEGGTNTFAIEGTAELAKELLDQLETTPDEIRLCCGTGGTAAGLIQGLAGKSFVSGYSVLKGNFHQALIESLLGKEENLKNWQIKTDAHCGGYAKTTPDLLHFMQDFAQAHQVFLDPIYTGKLFWAFWKDLTSGQVAPGSKVVLLHSGGLQGIAGFNERMGSKLPIPLR